MSFSSKSLDDEFTIIDQAQFEHSTFSDDGFEHVKIAEMEQTHKENTENGNDNGHKMNMANPDTLADRMKLLLSAAKGADAHFVVGKNDEKKEVVQRCLMCIDKNADDLIKSDELLLSTAKGADAHFVVGKNDEKEEVVQRCLMCIDKNADILIKSDAFLQIDQNLLYEILARDELQIREEISIWNAALRWADAKCRENGLECTAENRRAVLGPALFKIRFPLFSKEEFSEKIVSSGVLKMEEVIGIYQFLCLPNFRGTSGGLLYPLQFPSHWRIWTFGTIVMDIEKVSQFMRQIIGSKRHSEVMKIKGFPWKIMAQILLKTEYAKKVKESREKWRESSERWRKSQAKLMENSEKMKQNAREQKENGEKLKENTEKMEENKAKLEKNNEKWEEIIEKLNEKTKEMEEITKKIKENTEKWTEIIEKMEANTKKLEENTDKMEEITKRLWENMKENAREMKENSERLEENAKKLEEDRERLEENANKLMENGERLEENANKIEETENDENNKERKEKWEELKKWREIAGGEKWLGFFLLYDAPKNDSNLGCVCSATLRIVSQKSEVRDFQHKFSDVTMKPRNCWGFSNFISFAVTENRRPMLGPALFTIRFRLLTKKEIWETIVPSGVLTADEVIGVEQYHNHANGIKEGIPYTLRFPTHRRFWAFGTIAMDIEKVSEFALEEVESSRKSEKVYINGLPWKIWAKIKTKKESTDNNEKWLAIYLLYDGPKEDLNGRCCVRSATFRIVLQKNGAENSIGTICDCVFNNKSTNWGFNNFISFASGVADLRRELDDDVFDNQARGWGYNFISFAELMDPEKGFYDQSEDKVKLAIDFTVKEAKKGEKS
ncbi:hypothetical protein niasHT_033814 [Heterodera trifolii]|uniref:MATH domain-containing protein n=1 Tax=Heterodera trifolii TaxID=157864 RepID=A0ABD2J7D9_9BILA